jgi:hypothetical protein
MGLGLEWSPGIGDPTPAGWFTLAAYFGTTLLCVAAALRPPRNNLIDAALDRRFWIGTATLFLFLGVNKQLDLQTLIVEIARSLAKADGWYNRRHHYQRAFLLSISLLTAVLLVAAARIVRWRSPAIKIAIFGLTLTCSFVLIRAASFHHIDTWLGGTVLHIRWNWLLELSGIGIVAAAASVTILARRKVEHATVRAPKQSSAAEGQD